MKSIKGRLLRVFFLLITTTTIGSLFFFVLNLKVIEQYRSISEVMIAEYRLVDTTSNLIAAYNTRIQSAGTDIRFSDQQVQLAKSEIHTLILFLDNNITNIESKSNYLGLKNSVEKLVLVIDESLKKIEEKNISDYVDDYNKANNIYGFVRENGTNLIFSELKYSSSLSRTIDRNSLVTAIFGLSALFLYSVGCIVFSLRFSKIFTEPLSNLTFASKQLAEGDMNVVISQKILEREDELGILSRSFHTMTIRLRDKITQLDQAKKIVEDNLKEVERMKAVMIDREMKMIELKKEIEKLRSTK